jgi:hypothetical protein
MKPQIEKCSSFYIETEKGNKIKKTSTYIVGFLRSKTWSIESHWWKTWWWC